MNTKSSWLTIINRGHNLLIAGFMFLCVVLTVSCTQNQRARNFGGNATYTLLKGQKLVMVTWKEDDLWYLSRPMKEGEDVETYTLQEDIFLRNAKWYGNNQRKQIIGYLPKLRQETYLDLFFSIMPTFSQYN